MKSENPGYKREENRGLQRGAVDLVGTVIVGSLTQYLTPISGAGASRAHDGAVNCSYSLQVFLVARLLLDFPTFISHSSVTAPAPPRRGPAFLAQLSGAMNLRWLWSRPAQKNLPGRYRTRPWSGTQRIVPPPQR